MRTKLRPGEMIETITEHELRDHLERNNDILLEKLGKNARFIRHVANVQADANGNFTLKLGPPDGFIWDVRGIVCASSATTTLFGVYYNDASSLVNVIMPDAGLNELFTFSKQVIVHSSETLVFVQGTTSAGANAFVSVRLDIIEVPVSHEAQLLL